MNEIYMTLCDSCAERIDANQRTEGRYYLTEVPGSRRLTQCTRCFQAVMCSQYGAKSKAIVAMERALKQQAATGGYTPKHDHRARDRGSWREEE